MKLLALVSQLKWAGAFLGVVMFTLFSFNPFGGGEYTLTAPFDTAAGLYPGSDVLIAGSKAGTVQNISLSGDKALVTFSVDAPYTPVNRNATVTLRPKSLLGEKYIALDPGTSGGTLQSGAVLSASQVKRSVELEEIVNSLDAPTREKLRTLVIELGGGLAGQGLNTNETFTYGTQDMNDLAAVTKTIQNRDAQVQEALQALDAVMSELSRDDRRNQLGQLIVNTQRLMNTLANEDGRLQSALVEANAALSRSDTALTGTAPSLSRIMNTLPGLVHNAHLLTGDFATGLDHLLQPCAAGTECSQFASQANPGNRNGSPNSLFAELLTGVDEGGVVFGGRDANGYATRVAVLVDSGSVGGGGSPPIDCTKFTDPATRATCEKLKKLLGGGGAAGAQAKPVSNQPGPTLAIPLDGAVTAQPASPADANIYRFMVASQ